VEKFICAILYNMLPAHPSATRPFMLVDIQTVL
jgi:hypothetical protein